MMQARKRASGFTLIEVLMVIVILGMLATVAIVSLRGTREGAKEDTTRRLLEQVANALDTFETHMTRYPTQEEGLKVLLNKDSLDDEEQAKKWRGPYLKKTPKDAWDNELSYELLEEAGGEDKTSNPYKLYSKGKDGDEGTEDDINLDEDEEED